MESVLVTPSRSFSLDSNDSISPSTDSRLPPDGREFPPDYKDPSLSHQNEESSSKDITRKYSTNMSTNPNRLLLTRHDEKSIKSVKAKIALFSDQNTHPFKKPCFQSSSSSQKNTSELNDISKTRSLTDVSKKGFKREKCTERSQSLLEIGKNISLSRESFETRRRHTLGKLKGLVIPESESEEVRKNNYSENCPFQKKPFGETELKFSSKANLSSEVLTNKPASRSASFTIAERKKSFESPASSPSLLYSSSTDSLRKVSDVSRRSSDVIFENENNKWSLLEKKYISKEPSKDLRVETRISKLDSERPNDLSLSSSKSDGATIKELAKTWEKIKTRSLEDEEQNSMIKLGEEASSSSSANSNSSFIEDEKSDWVNEGQQSKYSDVVIRDKTERYSQSRPSSLVETITTTEKSSNSRISSYPSIQNSSNHRHVSQNSRRAVSVNDIRRAFEKAEASLSTPDAYKSEFSHNRMNSLDSSTSEESSIPTPHLYGSVSSLVSGQSNLKDHYGSITSLASSTSLISPHELQGLIDEANQSLEESGTPSHEIMVIVLHREFSAGSIGITLAGGSDYESKDITVHKVIPGTLADRDGRIQKGDRVLSINGRSTKGVSHREALSILKTPRAEVVLVLSRSRSVTPAEIERSDYNSSGSSYYGRPPKILESPLDGKSLLSDLKFVDVPRSSPITVLLKKEGTGLGFSLEGGKDSPIGDRPLIIKKIFTGGAAHKSSILRVGDEIISVNSTDCTRMSRIEAWNFMKKLSDGMSTLVVRQRLDSTLPSEKNAELAVPGSPTDENSKIEADR